MPTRSDFKCCEHSRHECNAFCQHPRHFDLHFSSVEHSETSLIVRAQEMLRKNAQCEHLRNVRVLSARRSTEAPTGREYADDLIRKGLLTEEEVPPFINDLIYTYLVELEFQD